MRIPLSLLEIPDDAFLANFAPEDASTVLGKITNDTVASIESAGITEAAYSPYAEVRAAIGRSSRKQEAAMAAYYEGGSREADLDPVARHITRHVHDVRLLLNIERTVQAGMQGNFQPAHPKTLGTIDGLEARLKEEYEREGLAAHAWPIVERGIADRRKLWTAKEREPLFHSYLGYLRDAQKVTEAKAGTWEGIPSGVTEGLHPWLYRREGDGSSITATYEFLIQRMDLRVGQWEPLTSHEEADLGLSPQGRFMLYDEARRRVPEDMLSRNARNFLMERYLRRRGRGFLGQDNEEFYALCMEAPL